MPEHGLLITPDKTVCRQIIDTSDQLREAIDCRTFEVVALRWDGIDFDMWIDGEYACVDVIDHDSVNRIAMDIALGCGRPDLGGVGPYRHYLAGNVVLACVNSDGDTISIDETVERWVKTKVAHEAGAVVT